NLLGARLVATQGKAGETLKIDVSGLQSGIYLVETNNGKNKRIEKITIK
ncbi:T9SS type A sorting domain-containing protein, partial [bacterium]|nr:T9SS type A sorting domain-containing protein [bacterium]